jgi:hypothetical protein
MFFWTLLLSPRAMLQIFSLLLTAMHACQGRQFFFLSSRFQQLRAQFFVTAPLYCRVRSLLFL